MGEFGNDSLRRAAPRCGALGILALIATSGHAQIVPGGLQFQVNADPVGVNAPAFGEPSLALGAGTADLGRIMIAWGERDIPVPLPSECGTICDDLTVGPRGGFATANGLSVLRRRFDPLGNALDPTDVTLLARPPALATGSPSHVSIALARQPSGSISTGRTIWTLPWGFAQYWPPACPDSCTDNAIGLYGVNWNWQNHTQPNQADFTTPQRCEAFRPTIAIGAQRTVTAWVDIADDCPTAYLQVDSNAPVLIRPHWPLRDLDGLDLSVAANDRFVLVFSESLGDPQSTLSAIKYVRIDGGVPGPVYQVAYSDGHSPSVACFDDGSFAIAYYDFGNTSNVPAGLKVQLFDSAARANMIGAPIPIDDPLALGNRYSIAVRGPAATSALSFGAVAWMPGDPSLVPDLEPVARRINPSTRSVGARFSIPLPNHEPAGPKLIAAGGQHPVALRADGTLVTAWRSVDDSPVGTPGDGNIYTTIRPLPASACLADIDDGSGFGIPDGGVGIEDLLGYLIRYEAGSSEADVDNGSSTAAPDGGVGVEDLLFYLGRYDAGC